MVSEVAGDAEASGFRSPPLSVLRYRLLPGSLGISEVVPEICLEGRCIAFDGQLIMTAVIKVRLGKAAGGMQGISGNETMIEDQSPEKLSGDWNLVRIGVNPDPDQGFAAGLSRDREQMPRSSGGRCTTDCPAVQGKRLPVC